MPRANQPRQQPGLGSASLLGPPSGGGSPGAESIIASIAAEQQNSMQKVLAGFQKLQQQNALANQEARTAVASGVAEVLNQVSSGAERVKQEQMRKRERAEDKETAFEMAEFQAGLQQEIQRDARRVSEQITNQRQAVLAFLDRFERDRNEVRASMEEGHTRLNDLWRNGYFDQFSDGLTRFTSMKEALDRAEALAEDHFSDDNVAEAYAKLNKAVMDITAGRPTTDLSFMLRRDPLLIPYEQVASRNGGTPRLDPETAFSLKMTNGYPEEGVIFGPPEPGGRAPKLLDPDTFKEVLFYDSYLTQMTDDRTRRKLLDMLNRTTVEASQRLSPMMDRYRETNQLMVSVAPTAVKRGIQEFVSMPDPRKYTDLPRTMFAMCMKNVFPQNGEEMANLALNVFDGKEELKTAQEFYVAMGLESAAWNIREFLSPEMLKGVSTEEGKPGVSLAGTLLQDITSTMGPDAAAEMLGLPPSVDITTGEGMVLAQRAMTDVLTEVRSFAERVGRGLQKESALEEFKRQYGKTVRMGDVLTMHKFLSDEENRASAEKMLRESFQTEVEAMSPEEAGRIEVGTTPEYRASVNLLDAMLVLAQEMGPDTLREMAVALSGGAEDITTPNMQAFKSANRAGATRSPASAADQARVRRRIERHDAAKAAAKSMGQTFEEKGAAGVVGRTAAAAPGAVGRAVETGATKAGEAMFGKETLEHLGTGIHTLLNPIKTAERYQEAKEHSRRTQGR